MYLHYHFFVIHSVIIQQLYDWENYFTVDCVQCVSEVSVLTKYIYSIHFKENIRFRRMTKNVFTLSFF